MQIDTYFAWVGMYLTHYMSFATHPLFFPSPFCTETSLIFYFFVRVFLPQDLGLGLLYWAVSRQRQRNDCCTGQPPGNEMTVLLVSLQAKGGGVAKSKPCA